MKKSQLKEALRPVIKECIKEVIFEEGILSSIITEVVQGLGATSSTIVEERQEVAVPKSPRPERAKAQLQETKKKMLDAIGREAYGGVDLFEGTTPMSAGGQPTTSASNNTGPMANIDPSDPGVDISGILGLAGGSWKQI